MAGVGLPDFVQYQQAVVAGVGQVGKAVRRARPSLHQGGGVAPYAQGNAGGGGFAVPRIAEQVEAARFHAQQPD